MRLFYRLLHWFFFARAVHRGPKALLRYEARRLGRKAVNRAVRKLR